MMRSMFSGVASLRTHQTRMDTIASNIANVNTTGFKSQRVTFADAFYQTLRGVRGPDADSGRVGMNAQQIGLGTNVGSIDNIMTQGASQRTDNPFDLAIQGHGFFTVQTQDGNAFTRAGNVAMDGDFNLHINGLQLMGWTTTVQNGEHVVDQSTLVPLNLGGEKQIMPAEPTTILEMIGNLDPDQLEGEGPPPFTTRTITVFDTLGNTWTMDMRLFFHRERSSAAESPNSYWTFELLGPPGATPPEGSGTVYAFRNNDRDDPDARATLILNANGSMSAGGDVDEVRADAATYRGNRGTIAFDSNGRFIGIGNVELVNGSFLPITFTADNRHNHEEDGPIEPGTDAVWFRPTEDNPWVFQVVPNQGINPAAAFGDLGSLNGESFFYDTPNGDMINLLSIGRISMNTDRLTQMAGNTNVSFNAVDGRPPGTLVDISVGNDGTISGRYTNGAMRVLGQVPLAMFDNPEGLSRAGGSLWTESANSGAMTTSVGVVQGGALEMSNVDLGSEFTDMITTQRGFQAASRIISVSDEMIQELVNLRR